jgi:hypothetical protein
MDKARWWSQHLAGYFLFVTFFPSWEEVQNDSNDNLNCFKQQIQKLIHTHSSLQNKVIYSRFHE